MQELPLAQTHELELIVDRRNRAVLLHRGPELEDYLWAQFDPEHNGLTLFTEKGEPRNLGLAIPKSFSDKLARASTLKLISVSERLHAGRPRQISLLQTTEAFS